jgi:hypothetical protein
VKRSVQYDSLVGVIAILVVDPLITSVSGCERLVFGTSVLRPFRANVLMHFIPRALPRADL